MSELWTFRAYGGPDAGKLVQVLPGERSHWTPCTGVIATYVAPGEPVPDIPMYGYRLVAGAGGGLAFVPENNQDLREAFLSASGEPGDRETETLAAEIQRRGLDF
jgi:hypothetical protein